VFDGWNTQADGLGTDYPVGAALTMPGAAFTLYAKWAPPSSDANLSSLVLSGPVLSGSFDPAIVSYAANADSSAPNVALTATTSHAGATIQWKVNAGAFTALTSGVASGAVVLDDPAGINTVKIEVTTQTNSKCRQ